MLHSFTDDDESGALRNQIDDWPLKRLAKLASPILPMTGLLADSLGKIESRGLRSCSQMLLPPPSLESTGNVDPSRVPLGLTDGRLARPFTPVLLFKSVMN